MGGVAVSAEYEAGETNIHVSTVDPDAGCHAALPG